MSDLMDQYRCPTGSSGRVIAASMNREHEPLTTWGLTHITIRPTYVILDVGCGGGKTVNRLADLVPKGKVYGIDHSQTMVMYSREINRRLIGQGRVEITEESVAQMSFPDGLFDLVTAFETYYFWDNFSEALTEIRRVLKPGGRLLLVNEMVQDGVYEIEHAKLIEKTQVHLIPLETIRKTLQTLGFIDIQVFTKAETPWNCIIARKQ